MIDRDVAIVICSRGREECLARLIGDLRRSFLPALEAGGLTSCVWVYAQGYSSAYLESLDRKFADLLRARTLVIVAASRAHARIGDVVHTAIRAVHDACRYKLAMLMDDDSLYDAHPVVDANLRLAARAFIDRGHRAYSIKLGAQEALAYGPFVDPAGPIMPFKEKMLWASRPVLDEVLALPRFAELSIGEDAVVAALAWLPDPGACFAVQGMATFLHLGYEPSTEAGDRTLTGGYADLMRPEDPPLGAAAHGKYGEALRWGVTPHHILPDVFVGEGHPHYAYNGIREEVVVRLRMSGRVLQSPRSRM